MTTLLQHEFVPCDCDGWHASRHPWCHYRAEPGDYYCGFGPERHVAPAVSEELPGMSQEQHEVAEYLRKNPTPALETVKEEPKECVSKSELKRLTAMGIPAALRDAPEPSAGAMATVAAIEALPMSADWRKAFAGLIQAFADGEKELLEQVIAVQDDTAGEMISSLRINLEAAEKALAEAKREMLLAADNDARAFASLQTQARHEHERAESAEQALAEEREDLAAGHPDLCCQQCIATMAKAHAEGFREGLEMADDAGQQAVWDAKEREDKAISKGCAPYSAEFRAANAAQHVGEAIRALAPEPKKERS